MEERDAMDWLSKIPSWIKIPIKILLPALAIFSGFIILANDKVLKYLNLFQFEQQNGFAFAIIFLVCISLIICYIISYIADIFLKQSKAVFLRKTMYKKFKSLPDIYKSALIHIYRQPLKSVKMEISNSVAAYLMAIKAITTSHLSDRGYIFDFFLQPWVIMSIERLIDETRTNIQRLEKAIKKQKNNNKKKELEENLKVCQADLTYLTTEDVSNS